MKEIIGLTFKQRLSIGCKLIKYGIELIVVNPQTVHELTGAMTQVRNVLPSYISALAPSVEVVRKVVSERPYEPFGAPGITDTTKYDGNLAKQYEAKN
jgi:hypothetical protein